jgi:hypothetical protein
LRDDEDVPVICPTCQMFLRVRHPCRRPFCFQGVPFLCMGLFSIFWIAKTQVAPPSRQTEPPSPPTCAVVCCPPVLANVRRFTHNSRNHLYRGDL